MMRIKLEVEVNSASKDQINELSSALSILGGIELSVEPVEDEKPKKTGKKKKAAKDAPTEKEKTSEKKEPVIDEDTVEKKDSEIELSQVREALGEKLRTGGEGMREKCQKKLTELGAQNMSTLDPEKYAEFLSFLENE